MFYSIIRDGGGIGILSVFDDLASEFVSMDGELFDSTRPEGISRGEYDRVAVLHETVGDLCDRGGLSSTVDTDEHDGNRFLLLCEPLVEVELVEL